VICRSQKTTNTTNTVWVSLSGWCTLGDVPYRRLEDRIRELCAKALTAQDAEMEAIFVALQLALREHAERLRRLAATNLTSAEKNQPPERRAQQY
jgi:hypothetical protein